MYVAAVDQEPLFYSHTRIDEFSPHERFSDPKWIGYWLGPRNCLGELKDIKASCLYRESNPNFLVFQPAVQSLYKLQWSICLF